MSELKSILVTKLGMVEVEEGGRLRIDHESLGLRPPSKSTNFVDQIKNWLADL